jgi:hypothetical protein
MKKNPVASFYQSGNLLTILIDLFGKIIEGSLCPAISFLTPDRSAVSQYLSLGKLGE